MYLHARNGSVTVRAMQANSAPGSAPILALNRTKLDELRRAHGIRTEAELARRIGVNATTLWRVSNGEVQPSAGFIARLMLAFPSASMDALFVVHREALAS